MSSLSSKKLKVFTWHVHGNYLYYLTQTPCEFYIPVGENMGHGYGGRTDSFKWGDNVHEVALEDVKNTEFDCILFQSPQHYLKDQYEIFSEQQLQLPKVYLEHDPPREQPTDTQHIVKDQSVVVVHVTAFNQLMWDNGSVPTTVIEHGVMIPETVAYNGEYEKGIVVINNLKLRGRRLGLDIFQELRKHVPLDLVGMGSHEVGGVGEIPPLELPHFVAKYRFFFNPIRYTSLGLAICEAMLIGSPIVGLATTELVTVIKNGVNGFVDTNPEALIKNMKELLVNHELAQKLGEQAKTTANQRFNMSRFTNNWLTLFRLVVHRQHSSTKFNTNPSYKESYQPITKTL